ncbi:MAG: glycosyltransferase family 2 protein [Acidimicrobiales bacterium]
MRDAPAAGAEHPAADGVAPTLGRSSLPGVTIALPVLDEEEQVGQCLAAIDAQDYGRLLEVLVVDGGSSDRTRELARRHRRVRVVDNPRQSRPAAMNVALREARGEIVVRVDARTVVAPDYVTCCVRALQRSGAAIVGGPMRLDASTSVERGIRAAMTSRIGGGPAEFRREEGAPRFVDTVYLGAFHRDVVAGLGGYDEVFGGNEDAELAFRARRAGGVYLDPAIRSSYAVRDGLRALGSQYYRYGRARAGTIRKHPASLAPRQLAVPLLLLGVASPWRRRVLFVYATGVTARALLEARRDPLAAPVMAAALPVMHGAWGAGFLRGLGRGLRRRRGSWPGHSTRPKAFRGRGGEPPSQTSRDPR